VLRKVDQQDITHLEPLHDVLHRHQTSVFTRGIEARPTSSQLHPHGVMRLRGILVKLARETTEGAMK
jgi:hypothetical protein